MVSRFAAYPFAYFRQVMGRDAQARSVKFKVAVQDIFTVIKQFYESPQQGGYAFRHLQVVAAACVNVVEVKNVSGEQAAQQFFTEQVSVVFHAHAEILQGRFAYPEVTRGKLHDRIPQERQMSYDAIIAADGDRCDECFRKVHHYALKIVRCREIGSKRRIGQNNIVSCRNVIVGVLKSKAHVAFAAKDVYYPSGILQCVEILPCIGKNNSVKFCTVHR